MRLRITKQEQGSAPAPSWLMDVSLGTGGPSGGNVHYHYQASPLKLKLVCFRYTDEAKGVKPQKKNLELLRFTQNRGSPKSSLTVATRISKTSRKKTAVQLLHLQGSRGVSDHRGSRTASINVADGLLALLIAPPCSINTSLPFLPVAPPPLLTEVGLG